MFQIVDMKRQFFDLIKPFIRLNLDSSQTSEIGFQEVPKVWRMWSQNRDFGLALYVSDESCVRFRR